MAIYLCLTNGVILTGDLDNVPALIG